MNEARFLIDHGGKGLSGNHPYCPTCGVEFKLVQAPVTGIMVQRELDDNDDPEKYISIEELRELLCPEPDPPYEKPLPPKDRLVKEGEQPKG